MFESFFTVKKEECQSSHEGAMQIEVAGVGLINISRKHGLLTISVCNLDDKCSVVSEMDVDEDDLLLGYLDTVQNHLRETDSNATVPLSMAKVWYEESRRPYSPSIADEYFSQFPPSETTNL